jgi:hypothetical protein
MFNINEVIKSAVNLGITLTNADCGSELCEMWAARVAQARMHFDRGEYAACQVMINEANASAI